jgi:CDI toxin RNase A-like protein
MLEAAVHSGQSNLSCSSFGFFAKPRCSPASPEQRLLNASQPTFPQTTSSAKRQRAAIRSPAMSASPIDWLMARLKSDAHLHVASSYRDRQTAEAAIEALLDRHRDRVNRWAARAPEGAEFTLRGAADRSVGRTAWRPVALDHLAESLTLVVVVKKLGPASCLVLSSYPGP